jgi:uncharacterized membrane protein (UPF0127 family)
MQEQDIKRRRTIYFVTLALIAGALLLSAGCRALGPGRSVVVLLDGATLKCEVAYTPDRRSQGLQGRDSLAQGEGMLFVNDAPEPVTIRMKSVRFPIDVTFVDDNRRVVKIAEMYPDSPRAVTSSGSALYVIETPRGWVSANGIHEGSDLGFLGGAP